MLRSDDELICVARVLIVVNQIGNERRKHVQLLQVRMPLQITLAHEKLHGLQGIDNVLVVVVLVLRWIALVDGHA